MKLVFLAIYIKQIQQCHPPGQEWMEACAALQVGLDNSTFWVDVWTFLNVKNAVTYMKVCGGFIRTELLNSTLTFPDRNIMWDVASKRLYCWFSSAAVSQETKMFVETHTHACGGHKRTLVWWCWMLSLECLTPPSCRLPGGYSDTK